MTNAEIDRLLAEMIVEEMRQEPIRQYEFEELLYYHLCFDMMTRQPNSIQQLGPLGGNQLAQTYAASLPADISVNDPAARPALSWDVGGISYCVIRAFNASGEEVPLA